MMVQKMIAVALLLLIISGCKTAYQLSSTENSGACGNYTGLKR